MTVHRALFRGLAPRLLLVCLLIPTVLALGLATNTIKVRAETASWGPTYIRLTGSPADSWYYSNPVYLTGGCYYLDSYLASTFDEEYDYVTSSPTCFQMSAGWYTWRHMAYNISGNTYYHDAFFEGFSGVISQNAVLLAGQYRWTATYWT